MKPGALFPNRRPAAGPSRTLPAGGLLVAVALPGLVLLGITLAIPARAAEPGPLPATGNVVLSVERYEELLKEFWKTLPPPPDEEPVPPLDAALSDLAVEATVREGHVALRAAFRIQVLGKGWVKVPLLPAGTAISKLVVDGNAQAIAEEEGRYVLHLKGKGPHEVVLEYQAQLDRVPGGRRVQFPVPRVASGVLTATIPGTGWEVHLLPGSGLDLKAEGGLTRLSAALSRTDRVLLTWGVREDGRAVFTRAAYDLEVVGEGVFVAADYEVEIASEEPRDVPVVLAAYALREAQVEGRPARVVLQGNHHAVTLQGHGLRKVHVAFALNVDRRDGQPAVLLEIPAAPISRFDLRIPGKRSVTVAPEVPLVVSGDDKMTNVQAFVPKTSEVRFGWTDSRPVPEQNVRMNAESYYLVSAERGGLRLAARFKFNVISGKAQKILFRIPDDVVIYEVAGDGIADWRTTRDEDTGQRSLSVYLDAPRHGAYELEVSYDRVLAKDDPVRTTGVAVPLLEPEPVHRHQGFILLLAGEELDFEPLDADGLSPVGEESLPQDVRSSLPAKVAQGFKYVGEAPGLRVRLQEPRREPAKFDVLLSMLMTLDEGALRGQATADVTIKSGRVKELVFVVDRETAVLDVVAPALLKFTQTDTSAGRVVTASFTEEIEGLLRVGLALERILAPDAKSLELPPTEVRGADVQRGYLALASAAAVEVEGRPGESIQPIGVDELPRALTASTRNPILLAYKYSHLPYRLAVGITAHETLQPVDSRILHAAVATRIERQGNLVTTARYVVANQSRQFLRVALPEKADLWRVTIGERTVRPARDEQGRHIVPLPRAEASFPVVLEYAERAGSMGSFGRLRLRAPMPDLYVSDFAWTVDLPEGLIYSRVKTNLTTAEGAPTARSQARRLVLSRELLAPADAAPQVSVAYRPAIGSRVFEGLVGLLGLLLAALLLRAGRAPRPFERILTVAVAMAGLIAVAWLGASPWALLFPLLIVGVIGYLILPRSRAVADS